MIPCNFRYIFFDADDTLWRNEEFFRAAEDRFAELLSSFAGKEHVKETLAEKQEENIPVFGYGSKTFLLSMLDTAEQICGGKFDDSIYRKTKGIVSGLAYHELELMDGVEDVLQQLYPKYTLAVTTKGDLIEQLSKFNRSGLGKYFHHVEVMPVKSEEDYLAMARKLDILPEEILMVGNAVKSDIAPVIAIGGTAIHVPYQVTWHHEMMEMPCSDRIFEIKSIKNLPELLL